MIVFMELELSPLDVKENRTLNTLPDESNPKLSFSEKERNTKSSFSEKERNTKLSFSEIERNTKLSFAKRETKKVVSPTSTDILLFSSTVKSKNSKYKSFKDGFRLVKVKSRITRKPLKNRLHKVKVFVKTRISRKPSTFTPRSVENTLDQNLMIGEVTLKPRLHSKNMLCKFPKSMLNVTKTVEFTQEQGEHKVVSKWRKSLESYRYNSIVNLHFKEKKYIKLNHALYSRLHFAQEKLWLAIRKNINVYTRAGNLINKFTSNLNIYNLVVTENGELVVATGIPRGLQVIHDTGKTRGVILHQHRFYDVTYNKGVFYALTHTEKLRLVFSFKNENSCWVDMAKITLKAAIEKEYYLRNAHVDRIHVRNNTIFISSHFHNCLYIFRMDGKLLKKYGQSGRGDMPGQLYNPNLCGVDIDGMALVADMRNHRMQVCTSTGQWKFLQMKRGFINQPRDAVIDPNDNGIWIVGPHHLSKYVPRN